MIDVVMNTTELESALAGAAILDDKVARMLLTELDEQAFTDPTARVALWAVRRGLEAEAHADDLDVPKGEPPVMTDVEIVVEALDCAGLLEAVGGAEAVAALVEDRPALHEALERAGGHDAGRAGAGGGAGQGDPRVAPGAKAPAARAMARGPGAMASRSSAAFSALYRPRGTSHRTTRPSTDMVFSA